MFINKRTALRAEPVGVQWITRSIGMTPQVVREDRILHELIATGGDTRRICDLFGLSIAGANRYAATLNHPDSPRPDRPGATYSKRPEAARRAKHGSTESLSGRCGNPAGGGQAQGSIRSESPVKS
jgi:hypothetical protein